MPRKANPYTRVTDVVSFVNAGWWQYWAKSVGLDECDRISKESREFGTGVHKIIENALNTVTILSPGTNRQSVCAGYILKWLEETKAVPLILPNGSLAMECELKDEELKLTGHPDVVLTINGVNWIADFKTSKDTRHEYPLQMAAYCMMLEKQHGVKVNDGVILRTPNDPNAVPQFEKHEYHNLKETYLPVFLEALDVMQYFKSKGKWSKKK